MALATVGAAAAGTSLYTGHSQPAFASTPLPSSETRSGRAVPRITGTTGTTYTTLTDEDFKPTDSATGGYAYNGFDSIIATGTPGQFTARLQLPQNSLVIECVFFVVYNDAAGISLWFLGNQSAAGGGFNPILPGSTPPASSSVQTVAIPISSPVTIDNVNIAYTLRFGFGTSGATQQLWGARVGYINNPGLVSFPNPRRVFGQPLTAGATTGPISATSGTGVPVGAKSAYCAVQCYQAGVMTLFPDGTTDPGIANWSGTANGPLNLLYMLVPLSSAGNFLIHTYIPGTNSVYVDVWGYLI